MGSFRERLEQERLEQERISLERARRARENPPYYNSDKLSNLERWGFLNQFRPLYMTNVVVPVMRDAHQELNRISGGNNWASKKVSTIINYHLVTGGYDGGTSEWKEELYEGVLLSKAGGGIFRRTQSVQLFVGFVDNKKIHTAAGSSDPTFHLAIRAALSDTDRGLSEDIGRGSLGRIDDYYFTPHSREAAQEELRKISIPKSDLVEGIKYTLGIRIARVIVDLERNGHI